MKNLTDITIILDRSGSMQSIAKETIVGFNAFLEEQKAVKGKANLTLIQFDHEFEVIYESIDLREANTLSKETFIPRGLTSLLDAIGKTIKLTKKRIMNPNDSVFSSKVIIVIITDGHENNSKFYSRSQIFKKIQKMEIKHNWQFVFLGANQDAIEEARNIGIPKSRAMTFRPDHDGVLMFMKSVSCNLHNFRKHNEYFAFTEKQRREQQ